MAPVLLALCSYLVQAVVSIRVSMIFPEVMLLFALLAACLRPRAGQPAAAGPRLTARRKKAPRPGRSPPGLGHVVAAVVSMAGRGCPICFC